LKSFLNLRKELYVHHPLPHMDYF